MCPAGYSINDVTWKKFAHCGVFTVTFDHYSLLKLNCFGIKVYNERSKKQLFSYLKEDLNLSMLFPASLRKESHARPSKANNMLKSNIWWHEKPRFSLFSVPKCIIFIFWRHDNWKLDSSGSLNTIFSRFFNDETYLTLSRYMVMLWVL